MVNYEKWIASIDRMSLDEVKSTREYYKQNLKYVNTCLKKPQWPEDRRRFHADRKTIRNILAHTKRRIKAVNVEIHNNANDKLYRVFMRVARDKQGILQGGRE